METNTATDTIPLQKCHHGEQFCTKASSLSGQTARRKCLSDLVARILCKEKQVLSLDSKSQYNNSQKNSYVLLAVYIGKKELN